MKTAIYDWSKKGGRWFEVGGGFAAIYYVFWWQWIFGFEVMPSGLVFFIGPFAVAIGKPSDNRQCKARQHSDQMSCECGLVWDMNDTDPPPCPKQQPAKVDANGRDLKR